MLLCHYMSIERNEDIFPGIKIHGSETENEIVELILDNSEIYSSYFGLQACKPRCVYTQPYI